MSIAESLRTKLNDKLATFKWFERTISVVCIAIPLVLMLADKENAGSFRKSISEYVYMIHSYVFGLMLGIAAMLFIFNGAVYFKNEAPEKLNLNKQGKWYNIVLGLSLIGVIITPHLQYTVAHYIFAGIFFVGNAVVTGLFHEKKDRPLSIIMAIMTLAALGIYFTGLFPAFTILWAEWISLTVIGIHFFLESRR